MWYVLAYILFGISFAMFIVIKARRKGNLLTITVGDVVALLSVVLLWPFAASAVLWWSIHDIVLIGGKDD